MLSRGLSHRQIACHLELPETTVNIRLYTARQHLKQELEAMATLEDLTPLGPIHDRLATSLESVFGESMEMAAHVAAAGEIADRAMMLDELGHKSIESVMECSIGRQARCKLSGNLTHRRNLWMLTSDRRASFL